MLEHEVAEAVSSLDPDMRDGLLLQIVGKRRWSEDKDGERTWFIRWCFEYYKEYPWPNEFCGIICDRIVAIVRERVKLERLGPHDKENLFEILGGTS